MEINKIKSYLSILNTNGFIGSFRILKNKITRNRFKNYKAYQNLFLNKSGIELGGPSPYFNNEIPIYEVIKSCDGVNFNSNTVWEGEITEGENYKYQKYNLGYQFICDAIHLKNIENNTYDFVLSCNNLEHIANPLKAVKEWLRVLNNDGLILLVLPNKANNFDHNRPYTSFDHLLSDFKNDIKEDDLTHLKEILELHDLSLDKPAGDHDNFKKRSLKNYENRCLHHHVYNIELLTQIYNYFNIQILITQNTDRDFIILGKKTVS